VYYWLLSAVSCDHFSLCYALFPLRIAGPVIDDAKAGIESYIEHRMKREHQILGKLAAAQQHTVLTSLQLTLAIYGSLPLPIMFSAHKNVTQHLQKLQSDGKIEPVNSIWLPCCWRLC
jgi:Beta-lactamase associated winged helix domain